MSGNGEHAPEESLLERLTPRETEVFSLLAQGLTNAEIAGRLSMALSSIKWYVRQVYAKLGVHSRQDAVARARELGLGGLGSPASAADHDRTGQGSPSSNLPRPLSSFIGREQQKREIRQSLNAAPVRLLTLTGPAGCGKTRLALEVTVELLLAFQGRVWWTDLVPLAEPTLLPQVVASALHVREKPDQSALDGLVVHLQPAPALLILDNCEHLLAACASLAQALLGACPDLKILATSREGLRVADETTWPVPPMSLPASDRLPVEMLLESEAIRLFAERARSALPTFVLTAPNAASVAEVCRRLDGIPLAIELAAARVKLLSTAQIAERLGDALGLLTRSGPLAAQRHVTLRAALDWSHDLLSDRERALLRRLSVFSGGFSLEAAEAICAGEPLGSNQVLDALSDLVDHSLIVVDSPSGGARRFRLLEIVHQFADEKLQESGEAVAYRERHLDWFLQLAEQAEPELIGPGQAAWTARLEPERGNLRAALGWSLRESDRIEAGIKIASALVQFWQLRGDFAEGLAWLDLALSRVSEASVIIRAGLLESKGFFTIHRGTFEQAHRYFEQAAALFREAGDTPGLGRQLHFLAQASLGRGDTAQALDFARQGLEIFRAAGDRWWASACLFALGDAAFIRGDVEQAAESYRESMALVQERGQTFAVARRLVRLGQVARAQRDFARAHTHLVKGLTLTRQIGDDWGLTMALAGLGALAVAQDQPERGARLLGVTQARLDEFGARLWPLDRFEYERTLETLHSVLGPAAFKTKSDEGRALSLEQALAYAMETPEVEGQSSLVAREGASKRPAGLTQRELEILRLIAAGESNQAIADELVLSVRTVERHTANIYQKIGVAGPAARVAAANFAFRHGLGRSFTPSPNPASSPLQES